MQDTKRTPLIVILALLLLGTSALAATKVKVTTADEVTAPTSEQTREEMALSLISFPWQVLKYKIVFLPPRPGFRAMIIPNKHRIEIYARQGDTPGLMAYDIAHELGHAIDFTLNTPETRKKWMKSRGINPATPWFGCNRCSDFNTPAGDFAETFALLLLGPEHFSGRIAQRPTMRQLAELASFFPKNYFQNESPVNGSIPPQYTAPGRRKIADAATTLDVRGVSAALPKAQGLSNPVK